MSVAIQEHDVTVLLGDVRDQLATLPDESVNCVVTSPPYYGLRAYGDDPREIGREASPAEYIGEIAGLINDQIARLLRRDGTLWLNMADCYYSGRGNPGPNADDKKNQSRRGWVRPLDRPGQEWGRRKSLLMIPERVVLALIDGGWVLRNKGIWHKPNAMPESVTDRLASRYEHIYLLTRGPRYYFDLDAIKVPTTGIRAGNTVENRQRYGASTGTGNGARRFGGNPGSTLLDVHETRNPGDVWSIPTKGFAGDHPAVMASAIAETCILAGCPAGGTVLDPWAGSGTTAMVARKLGRKSIGVELYAKNIDIIRQRIGPEPFQFSDVTA